MARGPDLTDTIVAPATARERGYPRAIVRISGKDTADLLKKTFSADDGRPLESHSNPVHLKGMVRIAEPDCEVHAQVLFWPGNRSYTRQASAEIHLPGSLPLVDSLMDELVINGARLAEPGEFTLRAFLSGRMDLTEAEAVLGVINAVDQRNLDVALNQLSGGIAQPLAHARENLITTLAHLEAGLDFVEEDIEFVTPQQVVAMIDGCLETLENLEAQIRGRQQLEQGFRVVLYGLPNSGKSSLFNRLIQSRTNPTEHATAGPSIVSNVSGTTRDFNSARVLVAGHEVTLIDTAGVDEPQGEQRFQASDSPLDHAQEKSQEVVQQADVVLFCIDSSRPIQSWESSVLEKGDFREVFVCLTKSDLQQEPTLDPGPDELSGRFPVVSCSSETGEGLDELIRALETRILDNRTETVSGTAVRCRQSIMDAIQALNQARELVENLSGDELVASELRLALNAIGLITGAVYTDDILDVVFGQFCIGK